MAEIGEIVQTEDGRARVVGMEWGVPITERLPGLSDLEMMGQTAFTLATEFETADN